MKRFIILFFFFFLASSSSSLESLSNTSSAGVQSLQSSNLFTSQTRSTSTSSYPKPIPSENANRLSMTNSLSSSKFETTGGSSLSIRATPTPQSSSVTSKLLVLLFDLFEN
jgi:hypothetical protein